MEGGYPINNYNKHSRWQGRVAWATKFFIDQALASLAQSQKSLVNILELGCSEGSNSNAVLYESLKNFRIRSNSPVTVFWNDLPKNNWNAVSDILSSAESIERLPETYVNFIPRSFYQAITPKNSVHLALSCSAFHFLSKEIQSPDSFLPGNSACKEVQDLTIHQSTEDMKKIIELRHDELVPGGQLIFSSLFQPAWPYRSLYVLVEAASKAIYERGMITTEERLKLGVSLYDRRQEDWDAIFAATNSMVKVRHFQVQRFVSPHYEEFLKTKDLETCIADSSGTFRVLLERPFKQCLTTSDPAIFEEFMAEVNNQVRKNPYMEVYCSIATLEKRGGLE